MPSAEAGQKNFKKVLDKFLKSGIIILSNNKREVKK